ncbi:MAG: murein DD-endopeptidase MepM [Gilliamella sp.]|uniref:murein DD-endopeptidase MepM n=1 Tax=unclassified Gilliamella TaxID=2685620 RepID=UPI0015802A66|nr:MULTISPECIES: murein DD-endopeptidase MepM [unclassified Gilliamella]MCO6538386.1 murein DD-endopeptidase MepM [Gilliamella sp.]MCO6539553.1 murein DD-endopeptidase MepM [Gilliamella sp.]MCO6557618.1 murein DD-endopeptidase MepM [Gilliamella sp.]NUE96522.1 murein DD-endopeptidase MepM [Gilliamella sp. ESL0232]
MARKIKSFNIEKNNFKIPYFSILGVLFIVILFTALWRPLNLDRTIYVPLTPQVETTVNDNSSSIDGDGKVEIVNGKMATVAESSDVPEDEIVKDELDDIVDGKDNAVQYTIVRGDTLHDILIRYNVNKNDIYQLTTKFKQLANLRIGQQISWTTDDNHNLQTFSWTISSNNIRIYEKSGDKFIESSETAEVIPQNIVIKGDIKSSFVADARKSGLTSNEIGIITRALQWRLDFRRLQVGDKFSVALTREMHGKSLSNSQLLGIRIKNGNKDYYAILADDGKYYDINGNSLSQSFFRYPLAKKARVSSGFNPRRLHPVTGQIAPHNGVDFAVSRGTPVLSVGNGEVVIAKYSGSAGNYIAIRHGRQYMTTYMHLDKILVKPGQQVKQGDKIGLSGNTGRSTGPHLHFELHINNKPVNPLTASLPISEGLTGKSRKAFFSKVKSISSQLNF